MVNQKRLKHRALAYLIAIIAAGLATLLRMAMAPLVGAAMPFSTYFVATLLVVWFFGLGPAILNIGISSAAGAYLFVSGASSSPFYAGPAGRFTVFGYAVATLAAAFLLDLQRRTLERVNREADRRKAVEAAEREQRQQFETTLASIGDAVISTNAAGLIVFANRVALSLLRTSEPRVVGKPLDEVVQIRDETTRANLWIPDTLSGPALLIAHDGSEIPIDHSAAPIRTDRGLIQGSVLVFRDVTERRRADQALLEAEQRYRATFDNAAVGIAHVALDGRWLRFNDAVCVITGYSAAELRHMTFADITHPDDLPADSELARRVAAGEIPTYSLEKRYFRKDGSLVWVMLTVSLLRDSVGAPQCFISVLEDITARKAAEEAAFTIADELRMSNQALKRSNQDLERFAFAASHDLQEPLRMIATYSQLLIKSYRGQFDSQAEMFVSHILDGTSRMRDLLADLLAYSELSAGMETPAEVVDLNLTVRNVQKNLRTSIDEAGAVVTSDPLPALHANAAHFTSLFQNLLSNALKYRGEVSPRIHIAVEEKDGCIQFSVADNGMGIAPEYHRQIFEVFKRLHGKTIPGTGVGLAICKRVIEKYNGRIWVESCEGHGATFFFSVPSVAVYSARSAG